MRKMHYFALPFMLLLAKKLDAQCIKDIQSLINMPAPCFFVGSIDFENTECFDIISFQDWKYSWIIKSANDGALVAQYDGIAFQHTFKKFGGYEFCLEIDKDGDPTNAPDVVNCVTYTTCEVCTLDTIKMEYLKCPFGEGCEISLSAKIPAANDIGLKPNAKFIATYLPTPQEILGGAESYDIEFGDIDIEFDPFTDTINVSQNIKVPFKRGCFKPRIEFQLEDGKGAHGGDGIACTSINLHADKKFRCIACANENGECIASVVASQISNDEDSCNPFYFCNLLREEESEEQQGLSSKTFFISPNPAYDRIHFQLPISDAENRQLVFSNNIGQSVMQVKINPEDKEADTSIASLFPGQYFVTLVENGLRTQTMKIIIQR